MLPKPRLVVQGELGLRPIGLSSGVPDKSSRGLGGMSQYFAQILICFMPYIFRFLDQCIANKYNLNFFYVSFANKFWIRRTRLMLTSVVQPFDSVYVKKVEQMGEFSLNDEICENDSTFFLHDSRIWSSQFRSFLTHSLTLIFCFSCKKHFIGI